MTKTIWQSFRPPEDIRLARYSQDIPRLRALKVQYSELTEANPSEYLKLCLMVINAAIATQANLDRLTMILPTNEAVITLRLDDAINGDAKIKAEADEVIRHRNDPAVPRQEPDGSPCPTLSKSEEKEIRQDVADQMWTCKDAQAWLKDWRATVKDLFLSLEPCWDKLCQSANRTNIGRDSQRQLAKYPGLTALEERYDRWLDLWSQVKAYA